MAWLLNFIYLALSIAVSPWLLWSALRHGKYREGWREKLFGWVPHRHGDEACVWFHAVSLGEVNLLAPLISQVERRHPTCKLVISTTTKTGFDQARRKYPRLTVFYCPLDFSWAAAAAMRRLRPSMLVLAELELWPNLIAAAKRHGARVAVVNGRLSENSFQGYRRIRPLVAAMLRQIDLIAVQSESYGERFQELGASPHAVHVTGSLKFDGAQTCRNNPITQQLKRLAGVHDTDIVFLAGSTQEPEERLALETFLALQSSQPRLRLIIAPRHPQRFAAVAALLNRSGGLWRRRTELGSNAAAPDERILLIDTVGELAAWWGLAHIVYVGGSMGSRGGQNMIEPAAYGAAVSFGPHTRNFRDVVSLLLREDAAVVVHEGEQLTEFVARCLDDGAYAQSLGLRAQRLVQSQFGAAERTADLLDRLFARSKRQPLAA